VIGVHVHSLTFLIENAFQNRQKALKYAIHPGRVALSIRQMAGQWEGEGGPSSHALTLSRSSVPSFRPDCQRISASARSDDSIHSERFHHFVDVHIQTFLRWRIAAGH
jgi:hypothetical protein